MILRVLDLIVHGYMAYASGVALQDVKVNNPGFHLKLAFKLIL